MGSLVGYVLRTSSTLRGPARVRGPILKRTVIGQLFFLFLFSLLRQAADRQVLSKAKPPTVKTSKRYAIKITPHSAVVNLQLLIIPTLSPPYSSLSLPPSSLFPSSPCCCAGVAAGGGLDKIAPRSVVSRVWAAVHVCGPQGSNRVSFLSGHNHPACQLVLSCFGQTARHRFRWGRGFKAPGQFRSSSPAGLDRVRKGSKFW